MLVAEKMQECEIALGEGELGIELSGLLEKRLGLLKLSVKREEPSRIGIHFRLRKGARAETRLGNFRWCRDLYDGKAKTSDIFFQIVLQLAEIAEGPSRRPRLDWHPGSQRSDRLRMRGCESADHSASGSG